MTQSDLDWPFFNAGHQALSREITVWAAENMADISHERAAVAESCRTLVGRLGQGGWLAYTVPAAYGGVFPRLDVRSLCLIRQALARHHGLGDFAFALQGLGSGPISLFGDENQKKQYLPAVAQGRKIAAFALSEPDAGSDVAAMSSHFRETEDGFILNGEKSWISNGGLADFYTVFVREEGTTGTTGISTFILPADCPGFTVRETIETLAPHPLGRLAFKDCRLPKAALLGQRGRGFAQAMATLDIFRPTVAAAALGFADSARTVVENRIKTRPMFGGLMADLPLVQAKIGDMAVARDAAALLIYRAAWAADRHQGRTTKEAAMAKLYATEAAQKIIDDAVQIMGAQGLVCGETVERLYREIRALRIYEGASEVQRLLIGKIVITDEAGTGP